MIPTATSRIDGIAILQHHDGEPVLHVPDDHERNDALRVRLPAR